jgi:hypothetical protein
VPTEIEIRVMKVLSSIEIPINAGQEIQKWGNEAVAVVSETALGTYPGLRMKVRTNAVTLLGYMTHPQAVETIPLLINDSNPDISIRAMRAAGRQKNEQVVDRLGQVLRNPEASPLIAAESVKSLIAIDSSKARANLDAYIAASPDAYPHRGSSVVRGILERRARQ